MRKTALLIGALAAALTMIGIGSGAAGAANAYVCDGTLASGTYHRIVVPAGATCDGTDAVVTVRGGIDIGPGATFILGHDQGSPTGTITGGVRANDAASVQIHFARVDGGVAVEGGDGFFSTVEDNVINGGVSINGYTGFWLGFIRNTVHGGAFLSNNTLEDPDANEFVTNTIFGNLVCFGNDPLPHFGDSGGSANVVTGQKVGQCVNV
jgi:hypothetical protein